MNGFYSDANHPDGFRKLTVNGDSTITIEGNDNGGAASGVEWTLTGSVGEEANTILIDFSPKGGPKDLIGKFDGSGIVFPDGNRWPQMPCPSVSVVLGTMTIPNQTDKDNGAKMIESFIAAGFSHVDTARMYTKGKCEETLGEIFVEHPELREKTTIASKVNPFPGFDESLEPDSVNTQVDAILAALKTECIDLLYLHAPDANNKIEPTLDAVNALHQQGKIKEFGLSNFSAWEVAYIHGYCSSKGYVVPTVYQGMYNAITRDIEGELLPCCKKLRIRVYVYNPLAGGMLTGKHTSFEAEPDDGRFKGNKMYQDRFWKQSYFKALDIIKAKCDEASPPVAMAAAALRWVRYHSALSGEFGDGVILGASKLSHLDENLAAVGQGPLPEAVVTAMDNAWEQVKPDCPVYFRGQSKA
jgi:aflatoxin B1 aldehyde reductase